MFYTHSTLDRADHLRRDSAQIKALREHADARLVPVWRGKSLVSRLTEGMAPQAVLLPHDFDLPLVQTVFLGLEGNTPYFAVDISELDETASIGLAGLGQARDRQPLAGEFTELRSTGPTLSSEDGSLLAYANGMLYWHDNTRHCLRCGHRMAADTAGHTRQCTNEQCGYIVFPRTDPAVIMLVTHAAEDGSEPLCLLGRNPAWPEGVFSTLAGFVEPGESLENAVRREVLEEVSIHTTDVRYVTSQPWPFPRSIMLGFEAIATTTDISCDPLEIADARWFTREQIRAFGNWGDEGSQLKLPRKDSIARYLIERWLSGDPS